MLSIQDMISLIAVLLDISFFVGICVYLGKHPERKTGDEPDFRPDNPTEKQAPSDIQFGSDVGIKALEVLGTTGHKTVPQLAEAMKVSEPLAEAIVLHLGKSYLVQCKTLTPWDFSGGQQSIPPTYHITALGYTALEQFE